MLHINQISCSNVSILIITLSLHLSPPMYYLSHHSFPLPLPCLPLPKSLPVSNRPPPSPGPSLQYWGNTLQRCHLCTRCEDMSMVTWSPCTFFTDTHCVVEQKWSMLLKKQWGVFQYNFSDDFQEGRLGYEAEKPRIRQEMIFGQKKLWNNSNKKITS